MSKYWEDRRKEEEKEKLTNEDKKKFHEQLDEEIEEYKSMEKK